MLFGNFLGSLSFTFTVLSKTAACNMVFLEDFSPGRQILTNYMRISCQLPPHLSNPPIFKSETICLLVLFWFVSHPNLPLNISFSSCKSYSFSTPFYFKLSFWCWADNKGSYKERLSRELLKFNLLLKQSVSSKSFSIIPCVAGTSWTVPAASPVPDQDKITFPGGSKSQHPPFTSRLHEPTLLSWKYPPLSFISHVQP